MKRRWHKDSKRQRQKETDKVKFVLEGQCSLWDIVVWCCDNNAVWNLPLPCTIDLLGPHNQTFDIKMLGCTTKLHVKHFICYLYREYTSMWCN